MCLVQRSKCSVKPNCDHGPIPRVRVFGERGDFIDFRGAFGPELAREPRVGVAVHRGVAHKEPGAGGQVSADQHDGQ